MPKQRPALPLPKGWTARVRSAVLHVVCLARYSMAASRGRAADSDGIHRHLQVKIDRLRQEAALRQEEIRIKDARMAQLSPQRRPHYPPTERMAILELRAARGWSLEQTADAFMLSSVTIASWMKRLDEQGPDALVQTPAPVNRFPDFVAYLVQRLRTLCPSMGKRKLAETLCRAGLHLGTTTIGRMLRKETKPSPVKAIARAEPVTRKVTAKRPNHVWHVDLTTVPIDGGFWTSWLPFAMPQCWPFCWWVAVVVDHLSRRVMGTAVFRQQPKSESVRAFLGRTIRTAKATPKYIICDRGCQFDSDGFKRWCRKRGIRPRFGALGRHGSIALVERFILTLKTAGLRGLLVPLRQRHFRDALTAVAGWFNEHRPHAALRGATPDEVYYRRFPACRKPRYEPRARWPRRSSCARPWALTRNGPGEQLELDVIWHDGQKHLPVVKIRAA